MYLFPCSGCVDKIKYYSPTWWLCQRKENCWTSSSSIFSLNICIKPTKIVLTFTIVRCTYQVETIILLTNPGCFILGRYAWKTCSHLFLELIVFINPMTFSLWRGWHTNTHPKTDLVRSSEMIGIIVRVIVLINRFQWIVMNFHTLFCSIFKYYIVVCCRQTCLTRLIEHEIWVE